MLWLAAFFSPRSERRLRALDAGAGLSQQSTLAVSRSVREVRLWPALSVDFQIYIIQLASHQHTSPDATLREIAHCVGRHGLCINFDRCDGVHDATASYHCQAAGSAQDSPSQQQHNTRLPPRNRNRVPRPARHPNQGLLPLRAVDDGAPEHARLRRLFGRARVPARGCKDAPLLGLKAAVALDCEDLSETLEWDRKNYSCS